MDRGKKTAGGFWIPWAGGIKTKMGLIPNPVGSSFPITVQPSGIILMKEDICRPDGLQTRTETSTTSMQSEIEPGGGWLQVGI